MDVSSVFVFCSLALSESRTRSIPSASRITPHAAACHASDVSTFQVSKSRQHRDSRPHGSSG